MARFTYAILKLPNPMAVCRRPPSLDQLDKFWKLRGRLEHFRRRTATTAFTPLASASIDLVLGSLGRFNRPPALLNFLFGCIVDRGETWRRVELRFVRHVSTAIVIRRGGTTDCVARRHVVPRRRRMVPRR